MLLKCRQLGSCMFKHGATVVTTKQSHHFCSAAVLMEAILHGSYNEHKILNQSHNAMPIFEAAGASVVLPVDIATSIILKMEVTKEVSLYCVSE